MRKFWRRRERCGALAPVEREIGMATCVLDPGHDGPHLDAFGDSWGTAEDRWQGTCAGCGERVNAAMGASRGPSHGGVTNFGGGLTVYCYATAAWEPVRRGNRHAIIRGSGILS